MTAQSVGKGQISQHKAFTCIVCPRSCDLTAELVEDGWRISGNRCPMGRDFALKEVNNPTRVVCSTARTTDRSCPLLPVRTDIEVPLEDVPRVMAEIIKAVVDVSTGVDMGDVIIHNVAGTGANVIASASATMPMGVSSIETRTDRFH
ncbi:MAG: DUF1667 domain-containing protein [Bacillota bacterium]|jgi:CxxC motif-containing protein|nr:DUF1667 domain-containing protein [Bacillota bacterium]HOB43032.1 DUF1667 domain-containing protein [Bacillota bacterium]HOK70859.1 DUF1667 domain-containing protein [Bacillota bacterium]HOL52165.1 DUF1667 domain-containing protein [Bacillota bacterium]HOO30712.1 DUF1667 domain-containing protein [Bacillota bacterium]